MLQRPGSKSDIYANINLKSKNQIHGRQKQKLPHCDIPKMFISLPLDSFFISKIICHSHS